MLIITLVYLVLAIVLIGSAVSKRLFINITALSLVYASILSINTFNFHTIGKGIPMFSSFYNVTFLTILGDSLLFIIGALAILPWPANTFVNKIKQIANNFIILNLVPAMKEMPVFVLFTSIGGSLLMSSYDLMSMYLSIELQSFGVYLYAAVYREIDSTIYASLKYFLLGSLSSCFILLGCVLLYTYTGLTHLDSIYTLVSVIGDYLLNITYLYNFYSEHFTFMAVEDLLLSINSMGIGIVLSIVILLCGFLFKVSAAPFHNWAPDVYDGTPTIITTWLTVLPKLAIFIFVLELITGVSLSLEALAVNSKSSLNEFLDISALGTMMINENTNINPNSLGVVNNFNGLIYLIQTYNIEHNFKDSLNSLNGIQNLILISSLLSLIIGTVVGLNQIRIKRLLAYSTISHVGFLLLGLTLNTENSVQSFIFYLFQYSLTNLDLFLILLALGYYLVEFKIWTQIKDKTENMWYNYTDDIVKKTDKDNNKDSADGLGNKSTPWRDIEFINTLEGLFTKLPLLSLSFAICLFSMSGIPPLMGFFAKQQILFSTINSNLYFLSIIAIIVSVVSASYYLKLIRTVCFSSFVPSEGQVVPIFEEINFHQISNNKFVPWANINNFGREHKNTTLNTIHTFSISLLSLVVLAFIFKQSLILNTAYLVGESTWFTE